jgi:hypothetical protein
MATFDRTPGSGLTELTAPRRGLTTPRAAGVAGIVFAVLFAATAVMGGLVAGNRYGTAAPTDLATVGFARSVGYSLLFVYASKAAGVFTLVTSTIIRRSGWSRWTFLSGYATAVLLILSISFFEPIVLIFAAWVAVVSLYLLVTGGEGSRVV